MEQLLEHEPGLRLGFFFSILLAMASWEILAPRRPLQRPRLRRWAANLGVVVTDSLTLRLAMPILAVGAALHAEARGYGFFNHFFDPFVDHPELQYWIAFAVSFVLLDLLIYTQHVVFHKVPLLWRLHRMHHTDTDFDVTTALRFHPLEIVLSMFLKVTAVVLLGAPAAAVLVFEIALNGIAMFNHGNVRLPAGLDRVLRCFVVTPEMHRVHHSVYREETDSNFGFNLPWWDRLFGTYRAQPRDGHRAMTIGLPIFRDRRSLDLHWLLAQPFLSAQAAKKP